MGYRVEIDNDCVGCETCTNCGRGRYSTKIFFCDICNNDQAKIYDFQGMNYCKDCLFKNFLEDGSMRDIFDNYFDDICSDNEIVEAMEY